MATETMQPDAPFAIERVVNRTFGAIGRNFVNFFILGTIAAVPGAALTLFGASLTATSNGRPLPMSFSFAGTASLPLLIAGVALAAIVYFVFSYILQAAIVHGTIADSNGRHASLADCLRTGLREFFPLLGIALLAGLGIGLGFVALIVPGIIIALTWSVIAPVRVVEHLPIFECFRRSSALTRGHRGAIFGLFVIFFVAASMLQAALSPVGLFGTTHAAVGVSNLMSIFVNIVTSVVGSVGVAATYCELRSIKEGVGPDALAAVFA